jgi:heme oxygenase (mycobilin-producing)
MAVKVLITRKFKSDKLGQANKLLMELRSMATLQRGYVSGETLIGAEDPNRVVVISTWISKNRWEEWVADAKRVEFTKTLDRLLESPETAEVFLVGEKVREWVDMA